MPDLAALLTVIGDIEPKLAYEGIVWVPYDAVVAAVEAEGVRVGDDGLRAAAKQWADADCECPDETHGCTHDDDCPMSAAEYGLRAALAESSNA